MLAFVFVTDENRPRAGFGCRSAGSSRTAERGDPSYSVSGTTGEKPSETAAGTSHSSPSGRDRTIRLFQMASLHRSICPHRKLGHNYAVLSGWVSQSGLKVKAAHAVPQRGQMATQGNGASGISWGRGKWPTEGSADEQGFSSELGWEATVDTPPWKLKRRLWLPARIGGWAALGCPE